MILLKLANLATGIAPDLPFGKRVWIQDKNMRYTDEGMRPLPGQYILAVPESNKPILGMMEVIDENTAGDPPALYFGNESSLFELIESVVDEVTRTTTAYTGDSDNTRWSFTRWGKWRLATNGDDVPQIFRKSPPTSATDFEDIDGPSDLASSYRAQIVRTNGPHVLFFNTVNDNAEYIWCAADDPLTWTPVESNAAGSLIIRELSSEIVAAENFRDGIAVYGRNQMFFVRNNGFPYYFGHQLLLEGIGAVSKDAVVEVESRHFGFGQHGIWVTDGSSYTLIDEPVHRTIYKNINRNILNKVVTLHNPTINSIYFFYPEADSNDISRGFSFDYKTNAWGELDFVRTAGVSGSAFTLPITGGLDGKIFIQSAPESGEIPTAEIPLYTSDQVTLSLPEGYGEGGYGDGFYGGVYSSEAEIDDLTIRTVIADVAMILTQDGVTIPIGAVADTASAFAESDWLDMTQASVVASNLLKYIDYIRVILKNKDLAKNFQLTISYTDSLDRTGTVLPATNLSSLVSEEDTDPKLLDGGIYENLPDEAVYFKFRFEDTQIVDPSWHLTEFDVNGEFTGEFV